MISAAEQARRALEDAKNAHNRFSAMLIAYEAGSCSLKEFKWYFELVQKMDYIWLHKEAVFRAYKISLVSYDTSESPLDIGIEINRQAALRYLKEVCGINILL
jgi:hypothetical protein